MIVHDPAAYRVRSAPRPLEVAQKACSDFFSELNDLVRKHAIQDLTACGTVNVVVPATDPGEEPREAPIRFVVHIGDASQSVEMASYAHAYLRAKAEADHLNQRADAAQAGTKAGAPQQEVIALRQAVARSHETAETLTRDLDAVRRELAAERAKASRPGDEDTLI